MSDTSPNRPYVHPKRSRISQEPVNRMAEDEAEASGTYVHDTSFTTKVPSRLTPSSYRKSRVAQDRLKKELHYGQYLSVPKGNRDLFSKSPKTSNLRAAVLVAIIAVVLLIILILVIVFA